MKRLVAALMAIAWIATATPARAGVTGGGQTGDGGHTVVRVTVTGPGAGHAGDDAARPLVEYSVTWSTLADPARPGFSGPCNAGDNTTIIFGFYFHFVGRDPAGNIVGEIIRCLAPSDDPTQPPALPIPAIPTFGEAWNAAKIPGPTVVLDPAARGITGLDTLISATGPTELVIAAVVRGYTITGTVTLDHYTIAVDDQPATDASSGHFVFETKGDHTIAISAIWHGISTLTGPDLPAPIVDLDIGTATITSTRTYAVHEIRSVLQR
jgi:hypothetical protein